MRTPGTVKRIPSSFRDPSGFMFYRDGILYRQVNRSYKEDYEILTGSGLYETLTRRKLLISHEAADTGLAISGDAYKIIKPEPLPFISYPYEWSFSQLKDAALTTLEIAKVSLEYGLSLKDCSAYNIQFRKGRPVFIDTLSFERYKEGSPWIAYRQFCQHFLAPLALMCRKDIRLNQMLRIYVDGVPLDLAAGLLPPSSLLSPSIFTHIFLHAKFQKGFSGKEIKAGAGGVSRTAFAGLIDSLESSIRGLKWTPRGTEWAEYYADTNYSREAAGHKKELVSKFLDNISPKTVWDLGANTGTFSRAASSRGAQVVSFDIDPACVEKNYLETKKNDEKEVLPLTLDLTNPTPGIGWENSERASLIERGPADTVLALALIHHLVISNNLPLDRIAAFLAKICRDLIIEFVPKDDSQVRRLLSTREDIFPGYTQEVFEESFREYFTIGAFAKIRDSKRTLYLMRKK